MTTVAVIGSRGFDDIECIIKCLKTLQIRHKDIFVISGAAPGADSLGIQAAKKLGIAFKEYPAEWDNLDAIPCKIRYNRYGKPYNVLAGFNRNIILVEEADIILAFWDGKSPGTNDSLEKAKELEKEIITILYE